MARRRFRRAVGFSQRPDLQWLSFAVEALRFGGDGLLEGDLVARTWERYADKLPTDVELVSSCALLKDVRLVPPGKDLEIDNRRIPSEDLGKNDFG